MLRARVAAVLVAALLAASGCGDEGSGEATLRVYVSVPLRGPDAQIGRDVAAGAELALAEAGGEVAGVEVEGVTLDNTGPLDGRLGWTQAQVGENARAASREAATVAYIGELTSAATRVSLPITNAAGIPQVSPGATASDLVRDEPFNDAVPTELQTSGERTFVRLLPATDDGGEPVDPPPVPRAGREVIAEAGSRAGPYAAYGYEAMALILDAIARASDPADRGAVLEALLTNRERDSVLGTYSIDPDTGETTLGEGN